MSSVITINCIPIILIMLLIIICIRLQPQCKFDTFSLQISLSLSYSLSLSSDFSLSLSLSLQIFLSLSLRFFPPSLSHQSFFFLKEKRKGSFFLSLTLEMNLIKFISSIFFSFSFFSCRSQMPILGSTESTTPTTPGHSLGRKKRRGVSVHSLFFFFLLLFLLNFSFSLSLPLNIFSLSSIKF